MNESVPVSTRLDIYTKWMYASSSGNTPYDLGNAIQMAIVIKITSRVPNVSNVSGTCRFVNDPCGLNTESGIIGDVCVYNFSCLI